MTEEKRELVKTALELRKIAEMSTTEIIKYSSSYI